jgi:hypothetical protein
LLRPKEDGSPREDILRAAALFPSTSPLHLAFEAVTAPVMILNRNRELVFCNSVMLDLLDARTHEEVLGLRPGDLLGCIHANEGPHGCGSSESCSVCGVLGATMEAMNKGRTVHEAHIDTTDRGVGGEFDLRLWCSPLPTELGVLTVVSVADSTSATRRAAVERLFFHDLLNVASALGGLAECVAEDVTDELRDTASLVHALSQRLIEEIETQRLVLAAEQNQLSTTIEPVQALPLLQRLSSTYHSRAATSGCELRVASESTDITIVTDRTILLRVLGNMIKVAIDAAKRGDCITIGCRAEGDRGVFWALIPRPLTDAVLSGLFHGSVSRTMARGKLASYGMQLLNDRYLHGNISYHVSETEGTRLTASYPQTLSS